jgi:HK97 family phage prohead protease
MQTTIERRSQRRSSDAAKATGRSISGYAARFNLPTKIGGRNGYLEMIRPGAFSRAIRQKQDVRALVNHDHNLLVGRTGNGTLTLQEDEKGLFFRCNVATTHTGDDLLSNLKNQNWSGCSYAFSIPENGGDRWSSTIDGSTGKPCDLRELCDLDLYDVSIVTYPAYGGTSAVREDDDEDEEDPDEEKLLALSATASASRSMPVELRSRITRAIQSGGAMTPEDRAVYTRALLLETKADR